MDAIILDLGSDVKGDSLLEGFKDKIEIMSYSHNVAMQVTDDQSNTERTSGRPHIGEFTLTKFVDSSTPTLNQLCTNGGHLSEAKITVTRNSAVAADAPLMACITYTLSNVIISNLSVSCGTGGKPVETISLNFTKIKWELTAQKLDGNKEGVSAATFDIVANKKV
ncbi:type VI secretion system tube protein Hcp [Sphaerotilus montanus]|uniref:Type VI secretion system secreted protein Hcp n=1 Tax=Sphaerotilus montanus TaxID=522889 RepID=A0A7Y9U410_9BURK|nr:Hcp family type VI secretion system effector [Sphaerotilus montanus]NYG31453.1 type VI secretion system secreted protein Hcp [Sphaerotilus montanus]NZD55434.1 type VI secretion system tube protein Hcp [Sphaerotilus montanus]